MRLYLDNCCYNRPYDDQTQLTISLETQAKLHIQRLIKNGGAELVTSYVLRYEAEKNPHISAKNSIISFIEQYTKIYVSNSKQAEIEQIAEEIQKTGVKKMDSLHVACAIISSAEYFLSTDKRLLKYQTEKIKIVNPIEFISELEEKL